MIKDNFPELIKYGLYGLLTTLINLFLLFLFINKYGMNYILANSLSYLLAVIINYILNKKFVFKTENHALNKSRLEFTKFIIVRFLSLFADNILLYFMTDILKIHLWIGKLLSSLIIILSTFILNKVFVFKKEE